MLLVVRRRSSYVALPETSPHMTSTSPCRRRERTGQTEREKDILKTCSIGILIILTKYFL